MQLAFDTMMMGDFVPAWQKWKFGLPRGLL